MNTKYLLAIVIPVIITLVLSGSLGDRGNNSNLDHNYFSEGNQSFPKFVNVDVKEGLVTNSSFQIGLVGHAGVYVNDFNNDGQEDLLVTDGFNPVLFENMGGRFRNSGILSNYSNVAAAHFFDYDNSGYNDLLLLKRNEKPVLLRNKGGSFKEIDAGFEEEIKRPYGALSADYNRDGCIDLLITQWGGNDPMSYSHAKKISNKHPEMRPKKSSGYPDIFYKGNCKRFERTKEIGLVNTTYPTFTGSFVDFSNDNYPELYLANDFARDILYRNNQNGKFTAVDMGVKSDRNAMSSNVADLNGDLEPDLFVTNVYYPERSIGNLDKKLIDKDVPLPEGNNAFINTGSGFEDRASELGLKKGGWGWGSAIADFSNNGDVSVVHTTTSSLPKIDPPNSWSQMMIFKSSKDGFERINSTKKGFEIDNGRGISKLDYNNDGNLDLVMSTQIRRKASSKHFKLYRNTGSGDFLQLMLDGEGYVETGTEFYLNTSTGMKYRILDSRSDMLSQDSPVIHFGLGNSSLRSLEIEYSDGEEQVFRELKKNHRYILSRMPKSYEVIFPKEGPTPVEGPKRGGSS